MQTIEQLRTSAGLSRHKLAILVGTDGSTVYRWERQGRKPTVDHLRALARVLGVSSDEIDLEPASEHAVESPHE